MMVARVGLKQVLVEAYIFSSNIPAGPLRTKKSVHILMDR